MRSRHPKVARTPKPLRLVDKLAQSNASDVIDLVIARMDQPGNSHGIVPKRLVLLRPSKSDRSGDQLFLDATPVPPEAWTYDDHDRILRWRGAFGGGQLHFTADKQGAAGVVGSRMSLVSVAGSATAVFTCDVASDCGATYVSSGESTVGFAWDSKSAAWKNAKWDPARLRLSYTTTAGGRMEPSSSTFTFEDLKSDAPPWSPRGGGFDASIELGEKNDRMVWDLSFKSLDEPDDDEGEGEVRSVFPRWLQAFEDAGASMIEGVFEIGGGSLPKKLVGLRGTKGTAHATGYYRTAANAAPFGVFGGQMLLQGRVVPSSQVQGNILSWRDLSSEHATRTGLPSSGSVRLHASGSDVAVPTSVPVVHRLSTQDSIASIKAHADLHGPSHDRLLTTAAALAATGPDFNDLLAMNPIRRGPKGGWQDVVQAKVTKDLSDIMNSYIPADLWSRLFPATPQASMTGRLAQVAATPVSGVADPLSWYRSLSTAVLSNGLASGSDPNCKYLNGLRAGAWLKDEVAKSKVYFDHSQLLFHDRWQEEFPLTAGFRSDQIANAPKYASEIDDKVREHVKDIEDNVANDPNDKSDEPGKTTLKEELIAEVKAAGEYAKTNNLYWAFYFYTYNTASGTLENIAAQMSSRTGSNDGTMLGRLFQTNAAVLTALDPSGFFARQYTATVNTFLATNILPSMFGFTGDAASFSVIREYLDSFVKTTLASEDEAIKEAGKQIAAILAGERADEMLKGSIEALRAFANVSQDILALPYVATKFVKYFEREHKTTSQVANLFGSVLIGAVAGLAIFSLIGGYKSLNDLTPAEKAQLGVDTARLGLQIVAAIAKRGVRAFAIFRVNGMTKWQRFAAVSKITIAGETASLDEGLCTIGNKFARWLGDTEGSLGKLGLQGMRDMNDLFVIDVEESTLLTKIFGKNLDEFVATRAGSLFVLAGMGFSIYALIKGESGVALASDVLNLVDGSLTLFATVGEWLIEGGLIAEEGLVATFVSMAGPLAILAALAGLGLMLYELFHQPPNPVADFVEGHAKPAGFSVPDRAVAIDYATAYIDEDRQNLLVLGPMLGVSGRTLSCEENGAIALADQVGSQGPNVVWHVMTDGLGMSQIATVTKVAGKVAVVYLTLLSDNSVCFQARPASAPSSAPDSATTNVQTQTWLCSPAANPQAVLTNKQLDLLSMDIHLQPILPDAKGGLLPAQAKGALAPSASGLTYAANATRDFSAFKLTMEGRAPNYISMPNLRFLANSTPVAQQHFSPSFGFPPSEPLSFSLDQGTLPAFLAFDDKTGDITPNGTLTGAAGVTTLSVWAANSLGEAHIPFTITVV